MPPGRVCVVTNIPSPYQVELFDALAADGLDLHVIYLFRRDPERMWSGPELAHPHSYASRGGAAVPAALAGADLAVFGVYRDARVRRWMAMRAGDGRPWCFWGERPGARVRGVAGRWFRRWRLAPLHGDGVPIWGIGQFGVDGYAAEFGRRRLLLNLPYFSDLARFAPVRPRTPRSPPRLLFSGSLIPRKGVDVLAGAFADVAPEHPGLTLQLLGTGVLEGRLRDELRDLNGRVTFHGFRDWPDLPGVYAGADVLVAPSRYDGWGLIVAEGLAAGMPVIASARMGAALDLIRDGTNGWLVEPGSRDALAAVLRQVAALTDTELGGFARAALAGAGAHQLRDGVNRFRAAVSDSLDAFGHS